MKDNIQLKRECAILRDRKKYQHDYFQRNKANIYKYRAAYRLTEQGREAERKHYKKYYKKYKEKYPEKIKMLQQKATKRRHERYHNDPEYREKYLAYHREYMKSEKMRMMNAERWREYYKKNTEKERERKREYRKKNIEKERERKREYYKKHREKKLAYMREYRNKQKMEQSHEETRTKPI